MGQREEQRVRTGEETCLGQMRVFVGGQAQIIIAMALSRIKNIIKKEFDQNGASPFYSEVSFHHDLISKELNKG